jgi:putative Mg2+ transporter-C (MgtC) family protein
MSNQHLFQLTSIDWNAELILAIRMLVAAVLGALIGWDRERQGSDAGLRTCIAISIGACAFCLVSLHVQSGDPSRIAAQVVTGIGFLCAGVILQVQGRITGLTTAATLWATASIGMACAFGMFVLAGITTILVYGVLVLQHLPGLKRSPRVDNLCSSVDLQERSREAT